jgi:hypothetical protein
MGVSVSVLCVCVYVYMHVCLCACVCACVHVCASVRSMCCACMCCTFPRQSHSVGRLQKKIDCYDSTPRDCEGPNCFLEEECVERQSCGNLCVI